MIYILSTILIICLTSNSIQHPPQNKWAGINFGDVLKFEGGINHIILDYYRGQPFLYVAGCDTLSVIQTHGGPMRIVAMLNTSREMLCKNSLGHQNQISPSTSLVCRTNGKHSDTTCSNENKIFLLDRTNRHLVMCGTYEGYCQSISVKYQQALPASSAINPTVWLNIEKYSSIPVTPYYPTSLIAMLIERENTYEGEDMIESGQSYMYVGETYFGTDPEVAWSDFYSSALSVRDIPQSGTNDVSNGFKLSIDALSGQSKLQVLKDYSPVFKVHFQYAFQTEQHAFFATVQPIKLLSDWMYNSAGNMEEIEKSLKYHTILARACLNDKELQSYVETPLVCQNSKTKEQYPILRTAYYAANSRVSPYYGTDMFQTNYHEEENKHLIAIFMKSEFILRDVKNENIPINSSDYAICVYPFHLIQKIINQNVQDCHSGVLAQRGLQQYTPGNPKCTKTGIRVDDNFCATIKPNPRIEGKTPIVANAVYEKTNPSYIINGMNVGNSAGRTIIFAATSIGTIEKIVIENGIGQPLGSLLVDGEQPTLKKDVLLDASQSYLYTMSNRKIYKVKVAQCANLTSCMTCLSADPYCGWCTQENKCTLRSECQRSNTLSKWLPYRSSQCTYINSILPTKAGLTQNLRVDINISNLPGPITQTSKYFCVFGSPSSDKYIRAIPTLFGLNCQLPEFSDRPIIDGSGFETVDLHIVMQSDRGAKQFLTKHNFTFYDCSQHKTCRECTNPDWDCLWSHTDNKCSHPEEAATQFLKGTVNNHEKCPRFDYDFQPNILIPHKVATEISIRAINIPTHERSGLQNKYTCLIAYGNTTKTVMAHVDFSQNLITCQANKYEYEGKIAHMKGQLTVFWNDVVYIDSTPIILYKCSSLADDCTLCANLDPIYSCDWCPMNPFVSVCRHSHQCSLMTKLHGGQDSLSKTFGSKFHHGYDNDQMNRANNVRKGKNVDLLIDPNRSVQSTCPSPRILSITPKFGPKEGGTVITIKGHDLVQNVRNEFEIYIGQSPCMIENVELSKQITCKTTYSTQTGTLPITIKSWYFGRIVSNYTIHQNLFSFLHTEVNGIYPVKGPMSGGTIIQIKGKNLNIGLRRKIFLDYIPCQILDENVQGSNTNIPFKNGSVTIFPRDNLRCVTQSVTSAPFYIRNLKVELDGFETSIPINYSYMPDPIIESISPLNTYQSGGTQIKIHGSSFDIVQDVYIFVKIVLPDSELISKQGCEIKNSTFMKCLSPSIPFELGNQSISIPYGIYMDNIDTFMNLTHRLWAKEDHMIYHPDPKIFPFAEHNHEKVYNGDPLIIEGLNMKWLNDLKIYVAGNECYITVISNSHVLCNPPSLTQLDNGLQLIPNEIKRSPSSPAHSNNDKINVFPVEVVVLGQRLNIGWLRYEDSSNVSYLLHTTPISPKHYSKTTFVLLAISGAIFVFISFLITFVCIQKSRLVEREFKRMQIQMETLESNVRSECKIAFAELQTDINDMENDVCQTGIPYIDQKVYLSKMFFPHLELCNSTMYFHTPQYLTEKHQNPYSTCASLLDTLSNTMQKPFNKPLLHAEANDNVINTHSTLTKNNTRLLIDLSSSSIGSSSNQSNDCQQNKNQPNMMEALIDDNNGKSPLPPLINDPFTIINRSQPNYQTINHYGINDETNTLNSQPYASNHVNYGIHKFECLLLDKTFLLCMVQALENQPSFTVKHKSYFASLLSVALLNHMEYMAEVVLILLDKLINSHFVQRNRDVTPHICLRQTESIAEKMLSNLLAIVMYPYVKKHTGTSLFYLFKALKFQIGKGPIDAVTHEARYALSDDYLLADKVDYKILSVNVIYYEIGTSNPQNIICKINDCDTINQVKEKILDTIYKNMPYSFRPSKNLFEIVWSHGRYGPIILEDEDSTSEITEAGSTGKLLRLNTIKHYRINEGTTLYFRPIIHDVHHNYETIKSKRYLTTNPPNTNFLYDDGLASVLGSRVMPPEIEFIQRAQLQHINSRRTMDKHAIMDYTPESGRKNMFGNMNSPGTNKLFSSLKKHVQYPSFKKKVLYGGHNVADESLQFNQQSMNRNKNKKSQFFTSLDPEKILKWHLVYPKGGEPNKSWDCPKIIAEVFLTRLLSTKGTVQKFVDDLFTSVFSLENDLPPFVKYLFDFLDNQAHQYFPNDPNLSHTWKNNCLPLRFWINVIKNPDFIFDVWKTPTIDSSLSVIAQTFMDSCSLSEHKLGKDSPSNKLLYAKDIPNYKKMLVRFYDDLQNLPKVSDLRLKESLKENENFANSDVNKPLVYNHIMSYMLKYRTEIVEYLDSNQASSSKNLPHSFYTCCEMFGNPNPPNQMDCLYGEAVNKNTSKNSKLHIKNEFTEEDSIKLLPNVVNSILPTPMIYQPYHMVESNNNLPVNNNDNVPGNLLYDTIEKFSYIMTNRGYTLLPSINANSNANNAISNITHFKNDPYNHLPALYHGNGEVNQQPYGLTGDLTTKRVRELQEYRQNPQFMRMNNTDNKQFIHVSTYPPRPEIF